MRKAGHIPVFYQEFFKNIRNGYANVIKYPLLFRPKIFERGGGKFEGIEGYHIFSNPQIVILFMWSYLIVYCITFLSGKKVRNFPVMCPFNSYILLWSHYLPNQAAKDLSLVYGWYSRYCFPPTENFYSTAHFKIIRHFWRFWKSDYFGIFFSSISLVTTPFIVKIEHKYNLLILHIAVKDKYQEILSTVSIKLSPPPFGYFFL